MALSRGRGRPKKSSEPYESGLDAWGKGLLTAEEERPEVTSPMDEVPVLTLVESKPRVLTSPVTLDIPQELYEEYLHVAEKQEQSIEEVLLHRLSQCKSHNALRGLWFSDSERARMEDLLNRRPLTSAAQVCEAVSNFLTVDFSGISIPLSSTQARTLKLAMFGGKTPTSFFHDLVRARLGA